MSPALDTRPMGLPLALTSIRTQRRSSPSADPTPSGLRPLLRRLPIPDAATLAVLVAFAAAVHATGMGDYPNWVDDPGTYLSQAWSAQNLHALSPYSYFYDHAPLGWLQIAAWSALTNGFARHTTSMDFGNECMLIARLVSVVLLYLLARRLRLRIPFAAATVVAFAVSPLAIHYTRLTYLDNLVTPWLLLAFYLWADPRRHLLSIGLGAFAFGGAALTKETVLVTLPAAFVALWQASDRRTRDKALAVAGLGASWMTLYPILALVKGELLAGPGHNSLLGTALWQLHDRTPSGSVLEGGSITQGLWNDWYRYDPAFLAVGFAAVLPALLSRRLRPPALLLICFAATLFTGGYVPFMQVINFLPWLPLLVFGLLDTALTAVCRRLPASSVDWPQALAPVMAALVLGTAAPGWVAGAWPMLTTHDVPPLKQASHWVSANIPRDRVVVVHDSLWTDLVQHDGFPRQNVLIVYKVDTDPAVNHALTRIDYLVLPDYYYLTAAGRGQYPTVIMARDRAVAVARFGSDATSSVTVYRVSRTWNPRGARA